MYYQEHTVGTKVVYGWFSEMDWVIGPYVKDIS